MSSRNAATGATIATPARSSDVANVAVVATLREDAGKNVSISGRRVDPRWFGLALFFGGCAAAPLPPAAEGPPVQDLSVEVADVTFSVAGAWVEDDGDGHGVDAQASVAGPPPLTITGQRSSWRLKDGVVVFEGEVVAVRGDVTLYAEKLEVRYADGKRVEQAVATGAVRVVKGEREARGDRATLTTADGRVVLEGTPTLREGPNRMDGERIVLFLDDERLECERCRLEVDGDAVTGTGGRGTPTPGAPR